MSRIVILVLSLLAASASAATISVGPGDNWTKMQSAQPGDIIEIAPGTYQFRVDFQTAGTAAQPIIIRAQSASNPPVWDLGSTPVSSAPGSSTAGDKGRGCWQFRAGHYVVDGIIFKNCKDSSSAGIRVVNVPDVTIRNCLFKDNTNGVTGAGDPLTIEFSEFDGNGQKFSSSDDPAHQLYVYGGALVVRFSHFHDSPEGQDFHVRARDATLEYNWITRPGSYLGDLMTCEYLCGGSGKLPITQRMLLRGNVLVQGTPANTSQLLVMMQDNVTPDSVDSTGSVVQMDLTLVYNTVVGSKSPNSAAVHERNDTVATAAHLSDNVILDFKTVELVESPALGNSTLDGQANWVTTGTDVSTLAGSHFGTDPMISASYVPLAGSPIINSAANISSLSPTFEYYRDETVHLMGRVRSSANDPGAFESTTSSTPFGGIDGGSDDGGVTGGGGGGTTVPPISGGGGSTPAPGCGCVLSGTTLPALWGPAALAGVFLVFARRKR